MKAINVLLEFIVVWFTLLCVIHSCSNDKCFIQGTIDVVDYYKEYADSVFNTKQHF